jgi:hypothetical protein
MMMVQGMNNGLEVESGGGWDEIFVFLGLQKMLHQPSDWERSACALELGKGQMV